MPSLQEELNVLMNGFVSQAPADVLRTSSEQLEKIYQEQRPTGLQVGDVAPDFTLHDPVGKAVTLSERLREGPVVLSFYRGAWCPFCNLELRALQNAQPQIIKLGASLIAVSPQTPDNSLSVQEKHNLTFPVLSDTSGETLQSYKLLYTFTPELQELYKSVFQVDLASYNGVLGWKLPVPATYVIDKAGIIRAAFGTMDYTKRMEPDEIIAELKKLL